MTNIRLPIEEYRDLETRNLYRDRVSRGYPEEEVLASIHARSRDNARTPMQWTEEDTAGFTTGTPWIPVNPNYRKINARRAVEDPDSVFHYYQKLISLRKTYPVFRDGSFTLLLRSDEKIFAYTRDTEKEHLLVVCNFSEKTVPYTVPENFRSGETLLENMPRETGVLKPYEARMLYRADGKITQQDET